MPLFSLRLLIGLCTSRAPAAATRSSSSRPIHTACTRLTLVVNSPLSARWRTIDPPFASYSERALAVCAFVS